MTAAAVAQQLGGLVIDGCVRDRLDLEASGFSVWARGLCIQGTKKQVEAPGAINERLTIGGVSIEPGDLVVGDADGVVVIAAKKMADVIAAAEQRETKEKLIVQELQSGRTTLDVYGWK
jgi:4-hydroxy-4-methyl-2-oxoglutarate aldolase